MKILLLGPPGAGKGTQAQFICEKLDIPQVATGDMLRAAIAEQSELGKLVKEILDSGQLVPDKTMIKLVKERIGKSDCQNGFLLDGFPRTIPQAEALLKAGIELDLVLEIKVSDEEIIKRLSGRRVHAESGRTYHVEYNPPQQPGKDDETGETLIQREDDKEETIKKRLEVYHQQTEPLVQFYQALALDSVSRTRYHQVDGTQSVEEVQKTIKNLLI